MSASERLEYSVQGMSCEHCERAVRDEVQAVPGVTGVEVSAASGSLVVTGSEVAPEAVIAAVDEAGYPARPADPPPGAGS